MANQQIQFAETIRSMKLAMRRRADESDSDDSIHQPTNRGNKLKRKAKGVQLGRLDTTGGQSYRRKVSHGGYTRTIISTNPRLYDEDGDPYSPTASDYEHERQGEAIEENPFGEVKLEELLRPLTSAAELPNHPSLNMAFTSKALTQMASETEEMLRRERASLWKAKRLLQRFRGDADWVPCGAFEGEDDERWLEGDTFNGGLERADTDGTVEESVENGLTMPETNGESVIEALPAPAHSGQDPPDVMDGIETVDMAFIPPVTGAANPLQLNNANDDPAPSINGGDPAADEASISNGTSNTHAMTTRARARSPAERTPSPALSSSASTPPVHPWFLPYQHTDLPVDPDLAIPSIEAEETRKLLLLYAQKQAQIVRSLEELFYGLARADRLRKFVYRSCKAEAHLVSDGKGNLVSAESDGEDWYDLEDWGIQVWETPGGMGKLEKGKDEDVEAMGEEEGRGPGRGTRRGIGRARRM